LLNKLKIKKFFIKNSFIKKIRESFIQSDEVYYYIRNNQCSENFIRKFQDKVDWDYISIHQELSEEFIEKFQDKINWEAVSSYQRLSEEFIKKFQDKVDWENISIHQKLSEEFIEKFQDKVDWQRISIYQKLSEEFIEKFKDKVDWNYIPIYQKVNIKYRQNISQECWLYKTKEEKLNYIQNYTKYKIIDNDYIVAYKSCRANGYSKYNFQYKYEVGKTYESHCDCNVSYESSFGLSAWTEKEALRYCDEKLFKVKIAIEDIGVVLYNQKIRCFKQQIIELLL
jgi:phosphoribosylanthranilate isomerase